ncbi:Protein transport protein sft2 [Ceratocystis pirilliformis]|uniref:Protein transport protein SFT2 n=1 Tax=Ceratocystis pirilliformis TaxID=259994 RepID=A0ABR3ZGE8_9PEZI
MASASFRDSMNSLGWSRREPAPIVTAAPAQSGFMSSLQSINPFGNSGYIQLPSDQGLPPPVQSSRQEEGFLNLSTWDRTLIFAVCNIAALVCFSLSFLVITLRPRKFVILWTFGSILFMASFAAMMGPMTYLRHLMSGPRLPFTAAYFGSISLTLYFSVGLHSTILTLFSAFIQIGALLWYLFSYFPMGSAGLRMVSTFGARQATSWMSG